MSNGGRGGGRNRRNKEKGNNGVPSLIPQEAMEIVRSLKEIVKNSSEHEIYAMLKECNMDPDDAVQKLLSQDHFHEVKSKREKKKEMKEAPESSFLGLSSTSARNLGHAGSTQFRSMVSDTSRGKSTYMEENKSNPLSSSVASASTMEITNHPLQPLSNSIPQKQGIGADDVTQRSSQPSVGSQSSRFGVSRPLSMADVVKMGRGRENVLNIPTVSRGHPHDTIVSNTSHQNFENPLSSASVPEELIDELHDSGVAASQHFRCDEWPCIEQSSTESGSSVLKPPTTSEVSTDPSLLSSLHTHIANLHLGSQPNDPRVAADATDESRRTDHPRSDSAFTRQLQFDDGSYSSTSSYQNRRHVLDSCEGIIGESHLTAPNYSSVEDVGSTVSSSTTNLQPAGKSQTVNIPTHFQVPRTNLPNITFGSYGSGSSAKYSTPSATKPQLANSEEASGGTSVVGQNVTRIPRHYGHEHLESVSDRNLVPITDSGAFECKPSHYSPSDSAQRHQHSSSLPSYAFESGMQLNSAEAISQQEYLNSLARNARGSTIQPSRESEYSSNNNLHLWGTISRNTIHSAVISMPEGVNPGIFPMSGLNQQANFADTVDYPTNAYTPYTPQQRFMANNNEYHQPPTAAAQDNSMKHAFSQLSLQRQPPGSYRQSHSTTPATTATDHYDMFSQSNDGSNFAKQVIRNDHSLQNEQSVRWAGGVGSRTMPARQQYDSQQGQRQQFGSQGYPNYHQSQMRNSQEHQEQIVRERIHALDYSHLQETTYQDLQEQILRDKIQNLQRSHMGTLQDREELGSSLDYSNLHPSQVGAFQEYQKQIQERIVRHNSEAPRYNNSQTRQFWE